MLTKRVIPCLDVHDGRVVKGVSFVNLRDAGDPVQLAASTIAEGADELVFSTSPPPHEGRATIFQVVLERSARQLFIPLCGRRRPGRPVEDIRPVLRAGADKTSINYLRR